MFSREGYECKDLLQGRAGLPVVVSQKQDKDFPIWKVQYGVSCLVFPTYEDAMDFCRDRFTRLDGKLHFVYSWKLEPTDKLPKGKKPCLSLRELEKQVNTDLDLLVNIVDGQMTVCELVDRYLKTKTGVRQSTKQGYVTVQRLLAKEAFGKKTIRSVKTSGAKLFLIKLQQEDGKSCSSIHTIRGVLRPDFQMAVDDDILVKNPFGF